MAAFWPCAGTTTWSLQYATLLEAQLILCWLYGEKSSVDDVGHPCNRYCQTRERIVYWSVQC